MLLFIECVEWLDACSKECWAPGEFYYMIVNFLKGCHRTAFAYETLPVSSRRKWLGVSGHIWSFAAQGQINNVYHEAFHSFLQIFSECWMKRLRFSTRLMDRWWAPDGSHFIPPARTRVVLHGSLVEHEHPDVLKYPYIFIYSVSQYLAIMLHIVLWVHFKNPCFGQKGRNSSCWRNPAQNVFCLHWLHHYCLASELYWGKLFNLGFWCTFY